MDKSKLGTREVVQVGIIVKDIEKTAAAYAKFFNVEIPEISVTVPPAGKKMYYRGEEGTATAKLAFFDVGTNLQIELIDPDEKPSTWREHLDEKGEGVHHIAFFVNDMETIEDTLEKDQIPVVQKGAYEGGKYAYLDAFEPLKVMIELLEND